MVAIPTTIDPVTLALRLGWSLGVFLLAQRFFKKSTDYDLERGYTQMEAKKC
jgi:hypothetical protein